MIQIKMKPQVANTSVEGDLGRGILQIELTNISSQELKMYEHSLPWVGWNSMILVAVMADKLGRLLSKNSRIDDPGPATIVLPPNRAMQGNICLAQHFPDFEKAIEARDIIVFWSYSLDLIGNNVKERYGGYLVFPQVK